MEADDRGDVGGPHFRPDVVRGDVDGSPGSRPVCHSSPGVVRPEHVRQLSSPPRRPGLPALERRVPPHTVPSLPSRQPPGIDPELLTLDVRGYAQTEGATAHAIVQVQSYLTHLRQLAKRWGLAGCSERGDRVAGDCRNRLFVTIVTGSNLTGKLLRTVLQKRLLSCRIYFVDHGGDSFDIDALSGIADLNAIQVDDKPPSAAASAAKPTTSAWRPIYDDNNGHWQDDYNDPRHSHLEELRLIKLWQEQHPCTSSLLENDNNHTTMEPQEQALLCQKSARKQPHLSHHRSLNMDTSNNQPLSPSYQKLVQIQDKIQTDLKLTQNYDTLTNQQNVSNESLLSPKKPAHLTSASISGVCTPRKKSPTMTDYSDLAGDKSLSPQSRELMKIHARIRAHLSKHSKDFFLEESDAESSVATGENVFPEARSKQSSIATDEAILLEARLTQHSSNPINPAFHIVDNNQRYPAASNYPGLTMLNPIELSHCASIMNPMQLPGDTDPPHLSHASENIVTTPSPLQQHKPNRADEYELERETHETIDNFKRIDGYQARQSIIQDNRTSNEHISVHPQATSDGPQLRHSPSRDVYSSIHPISQSVADEGKRRTEAKKKNNLGLEFVPKESKDLSRKEEGWLKDSDENLLKGVIARRQLESEIQVQKDAKLMQNAIVQSLSSHEKEREKDDVLLQKILAKSFEDDISNKQKMKKNEEEEMQQAENILLQEALAKSLEENRSSEHKIKQNEEEQIRQALVLCLKEEAKAGKGELLDAEMRTLLAKKTELGLDLDDILKMLLDPREYLGMKREKDLDKPTEDNK